MSESRLRRDKYAIILSLIVSDFCPEYERYLRLYRQKLEFGLRQFFGKNKIQFHCVNSTDYYGRRNSLRFTMIATCLTKGDSEVYFNDCEEVERLFQTFIANAFGAEVFAIEYLSIQCISPLSLR